MDKPRRKIVRLDFKKNRTSRRRQTDLTRKFQQGELDEEAPSSQERVGGKGDISRRRTVILQDESATEKGTDRALAVDESNCLLGRVLSVRGLVSTVQTSDGQLHECAVRRILKTLQIDQLHAIAAGDMVRFRPAPNQEGMIERIEPRQSVLCRSVKGRQHVVAANVTALIVVGSAANPTLKPHLIDRYIASAEQARLRAIICINKIDLADPADFQPIVGIYGQMGYEVLLTSAKTGRGIDRLRELLKDNATAFAGQSGVGKSSLLNAIDPALDLRVSEVSDRNQKGTHTTTNARLFPLPDGGFVVDTPGIRQFELWDIIPEEIAGCFRDLRSFESNCEFPNCSHLHEAGCAVKRAVALSLLDLRRYESYCKLFQGDGG